MLIPISRRVLPLVIISFLFPSLKELNLLYSGYYGKNPSGTQISPMPWKYLVNWRQAKNTNAIVNTFNNRC